MTVHAFAKRFRKILPLIFCVVILGACLTFASHAHAEDVTVLVRDDGVYLTSDGVLHISQFPATERRGALLNKRTAFWLEPDGAQRLVLSVQFEEPAKSSLSYIPAGAFTNCMHLASITFPDSVTTIERSAFSGCASLNNLELPDGLKTIEQAAFKNCSALTQIYIPDGVTEIGQSAFSGCASLKDLHLPSKIESIKSYAFSGCSAMTTLNLPDSGKSYSVGSQAFSKCTSLTEISLPGIIAYENSSETATSSAKPSVDVFAECTALRVADLTDVGLDLPKGCFKKCTALKTIKFRDSLSSLPAECFMGCTGLESIDLPQHLAIIGEKAFYQTSLRTISLPDGVRSIEDSAFAKSQLESFTFPKAIREASVQDYYSSEETMVGRAILEETNITEIQLPENMPILTGGLFQNCAKLRSVTMPAAPIAVGDVTFQGCTALSNITLPKTLIHIGESAFMNCTALQTCTLPEALTRIDEKAFYNCESLSAITIGRNVASIGTGAFGKCDSLTELIFPDTLSSIGASACASCKSLEKVRWPRTITTIPTKLFENCNALRQIALPSEITNVNANAFAKCTSLEYVLYEGTSEDWERLRIDKNNEPLTEAQLVSQEPSYVWSSDYRTCKVYAVDLDDYSQMTAEEGVVTIDMQTPPTLYTNGKARHTATFSGNRFETQIISVDLKKLSGYIGDADNDGRVTSSDARIILRHSARLELLHQAYFVQIDANHDGKITATDARFALRVSAQLERSANLLSEA